LETNYRKNNTAVAIVFGALIGFQWLLVPQYMGKNFKVWIPPSFLLFYNCNLWFGIWIGCRNSGQLFIRRFCKTVFVYHRVYLFSMGVLIFLNSNKEHAQHFCWNWNLGWALVV
jgi:hypothetical protein